LKIQYKFVVINSNDNLLFLDVSSVIEKSNFKNQISKKNIVSKLECWERIRSIFASNIHNNVKLFGINTNNYFYYLLVTCYF